MSEVSREGSGAKVILQSRASALTKDSVLETVTDNASCKPIVFEVVRSQSFHETRFRRCLEHLRPYLPPNISCASACMMSDTLTPASSGT